MINRKRITVFNKTNGVCFYCGGLIEIDDMHMDHYVPKSKGGKSTDNLVPSCQVCNLFKSDRDIESFREAISKMLDRDIAGKIIDKYFDVKRKPIRFWYEDNYDG